MVIQKNVHFIENTTTPMVSKQYPNASSDILDVQVDGSFTGLIKVEGRLHRHGAWVSLAGINLSNFASANGGLKAPGLYEFSVIGIREIRVNVESLSGGAVSVFGQMISSEEV